MSKQDNLIQINANIKEACKKSGRSEADVHLVAVTKTIDVAGMKELYDLGIRDFGENRVDVFLEKYEALQDFSDIRWHFIGSLQTRKVKQIIDKVDFIHSLDRVSLAEEIEKWAVKPVRCFLQLNVSGEESKHGFTKESALAFLKQADFKHIEIVGLMTMAPITENEDDLHEIFNALKEAGAEIASLQLSQVTASELSMGMTNDYSIAIEEGATYIRVGRALVND
ncbi:YggS family pyridoxal phosphate-dependent enzyme [Listeria valentina]|uniref:YggS family pyridoxal phosphate-dependent enzyme n=1 Tax=Listeria valentina TaxID=2705293 RepID=UPI0014316957|nr:YggS family pyridoxal phosphate-dependent enzyme [Listeria valentina]